MDEQLPFDDVVEFLAHIHGIEDDMDADLDTVEALLFEKYGFGIDAARKFLSVVIDYTPKAKSPITGKRYSGFVDKSNSYFVLKREVPTKND